MKHLKLWTYPRDYYGATWYDWYCVVGHHRDSDTLTRSNWECWVQWIRELLGDEVEDSDTEIGWTIVRENHWAVGWVEWLGVHKDVNPSVIKSIEDKLAELDGYPVFDEDHWSALENREYEECFSKCGAAQDWIRELRRKFDEECKCARVLDFLDDKLDWNPIMSIHEALIPSGEYFNSDNSGIWPHLDMSVEDLGRNGLARIARELKYRGKDGVYALLARAGWND